MSRDAGGSADPELRESTTAPGGTIPVVAAVVRRGDRVLLCQRPDGPHLPLKWEFPGGKIDPGESPAGALRRELREELGVEATVDREIDRIRHGYPEKTVELRFFTARIHGEPVARVHRRIRWVPLRELDRYDVPPPNAMVLEALRRGEVLSGDDAHGSDPVGS